MQRFLLNDHILYSISYSKGSVNQLSKAWMVIINPKITIIFNLSGLTNRKFLIENTKYFAW